VFLEKKIGVSKIEFFFFLIQDFREFFFLQKVELWVTSKLNGLRGPNVGSGMLVLGVSREKIGVSKIEKTFCLFF
jgi:hypothetical protein